MQVGALEGLQNTLRSLVISDLNMSSPISLPCMPVLTQLNISNNNLDMMPSSLICSPLRAIDIRNNQFASLNHSLIRALSVHLNLMYISRNYFNCCDSKWLKVLHELKINLPDINDTVCFTNNRNVAMTDILTLTSLDCVFHPKANEIHFRQMFLIVLFVTVVLTVLIIIARKLCCTINPKPFMTQNYIVGYSRHKGPWQNDIFVFLSWTFVSLLYIVLCLFLIS